RYLTENAFSSNPVKEIQVAGGQTLVGSVVIDNSGFGTSLKDFKIVGIGAERPILKSNGDGPALLLNDAEGVAIENLIIDCEGADVGVEVTGYLSGVRLTNLVFRSVSGNALVGKGISGLFGRQFVLENCRMEGISEKATLVRMLPSDDLNCRQILVRNCQFLGPGNAGLLIEGPLEEFEIRESIFHGLRDDIRFSGSEQTLSKVAIANNTFHQYTRGVAFESGPTSDSRAISLTQNLFVNGKGTAVQVSRESVTVEELAKGSIPSQNNWTDGTPNEGGTTLNVFANSGQTGQAVEFVSIDPASPAFLKPKTAAVRAFVKQPVGPRNYAGAVAP
ncbi:MAG: hypothetical protein KDA36_05490, partial [Planctomycetaceae bacterium]|nr:hypothetical protein [Planctomycetaceae bacterium]